MRKLLYVIAFLVFVCAVYMRAYFYTTLARQESMSVSHEWEKFGKPVDVYQISKDDMVFITKVSGVLTGHGTI